MNGILLLFLQTFHRYISYKRDNNELLFFILKKLAKEEASYLKSKYGAVRYPVEIKEKDFVEAARKIAHSVKPFFTSDIFIKNYFKYVPSRKTILHMDPDADD